MKLILLITISSFFASCVSEKIIKTPRQIFLENSANIPIIHSYFNKTYSGNGSSFIVSYKNKNYLITNFHVLTMGNFILQLGDRNINPEVIHVNDYEDIAILQFPGIEKIRGIPIESYEPGVGESAYAIGYPYIVGNAENSKITITEGLVSNNKLIIKRGEIGNKRYIQLSVPVNHGNSGGPVFNDEGKLIGMTTLKWSNLSSVSAAIPTADIIREINSIKPKDNISEKDATDLLKKRLDLIAITVNEMDILEFGYHYSPSVKFIAYPDAKKTIELIISTHNKAKKNSDGSDEGYNQYMANNLKDFDYIYYLMLMRYFKEFPSSNLSDIKSNPFLTSQLFLASRFLMIFMNLANLPFKQIDFSHYKINKITFNKDRTKAELETTVYLSKKSFPLKVSFIREWGIWFLIPSYKK